MRRILEAWRARFAGRQGPAPRPADPPEPPDRSYPPIWEWDGGCIPADEELSEAIRRARAEQAKKSQGDPDVGRDDVAR